MLVSYVESFAAQSLKSLKTWGSEKEYPGLHTDVRALAEECLYALPPPGGNDDSPLSLQTHPSGLSFKLEDPKKKYEIVNEGKTRLQQNLKRICMAACRPWTSNLQIENKLKNLEETLRIYGPYIIEDFESPTTEMEKTISVARKYV